MQLITTKNLRSLIKIAGRNFHMLTNRKNKFRNLHCQNFHRSYKTNAINYKKLKFFSDEKQLVKLKKEASRCEFPVNYYEFTACQELYEYLSDQGEDRPVSGIKFKIAYIDTQPNAQENVPVAVCLHGAPGGHWDFNDLMTHLTKNGIRVIVPNFPGYDWTELDENFEFRSSCEELAFFIRDFLNAIGVKKVDLGIVHSAGIYPGLVLSNEPFNVFPKMACINPAGLGRHKVLPPPSYMRFHSKFYRYQLLRPFMFLLLKFALKMKTINFGTTNVYQMSSALDVSSRISYEQLQNLASALSVRRFPIVIAHSLADKMIEPKLVLDLARRLGSTDETVYKYDEKGKLTEICKIVDSPCHLHLFKFGSHFVMRRYPETVNEIVLNFFKKT